jgi:hypothetical protein
MDDLFSTSVTHPVENSATSRRSENDTTADFRGLEQPMHVERILLPRNLCFLEPSDNYGTDMASEYAPTNVQEWMKATGESCPAYVFVAYINHHFPGQEDVMKLHQIARKATRDAGLRCYWIGQNCLPNDDSDYQKRSVDVCFPTSKGTILSRPYY